LNQIVLPSELTELEVGHPWRKLVHM
jgi:hypothetical protein